MKDELTLKNTIRFTEPGSLLRPEIIGRLVRGSLGVLLALMVWQLAAHSDPGDLTNPAFWIWAALGLLLIPYVVNIGFGVNWGAWPRIVAVGLLAGAAAVGFAMDGELLGPPLWLAAWLVTLYVFGHLGLSFFLSALLATPGCEMRAVPHLIGLARGTAAREHYCPGFIENVDRWERDRKLPAEQRGNPNVRDNDLLKNARGMLIFYGLPFAAIQFTGFVGGWTVAGVVWTAGFAIMGFVGIVNAIRSRRVHGHFTGPWFLLTAIVTALRYTGVVDISGPVLLNTGLGVGLLLYFITENIWGRYFGGDPKGTSS